MIEYKARRHKETHNFKILAEKMLEFQSNSIGYKTIECYSVALKHLSEFNNCNIEDILKDTIVDIRFVDGEQRVFLDGDDVSDSIRTPNASMMASAVSAKPPVRAFLLEMQRKLAKENNVVMDGRDIGTVVLPNATVKIYLTASAKARAERRYKELLEKGTTVTFEEVYDDMVKRDYNDMNREIAPLKAADDAILADTTECDLEGSLELLLNIIKERI